MNDKSVVCFILLALFTEEIRASLDSYTATRTTGISYMDIVGGPGTAAVSSWRNSTNEDDNLSQTLNIGFTFFYDGSPHTQFRVSTNGFLTFNTATNATGNFLPACGSGDAYSSDNTNFSVSGSKGSVSVIAPFFDDLEVNGFTLSSSIHYQVSDVAPNRVLTVQWRGMTKGSSSSCSSSCVLGNYNFQIKLFEASGNIRFVYGIMNTGADELSKNYSCGLNSVSGQLFTQQSANTQNFGAGAANALSSVPQTNSQITFSRTEPAPASGVPTCVNYHFPSNSATNQCRNSIIAWSACDGVPTAFDVYFGAASPPPLVAADVPGNFYNPGALAANTTYYWQIIPKNAFGVAASSPLRSFTTGAGDAVTGITSTAGNTLCAGASTTLTVSGTLSEGSAYNWTAPFLINLGCKDNPPYPLIGNCEASARTLTFSSAGTNRFDVFARGCNGTSSCQNITINVLQNSTAPTGISSSQGTTFCAGKSTTLTASGGTHASGAQYAWYTGSCGGTLVSVGTSSSITVTPTTSATYYVRREGTCPAATSCFSIALTVQNPGIGNNTIGNNQSICPGQLPVTINGSLPTGGSIFTYEWESSTISSSAGFAPVSGSNIQNYTPGALAVTTWFRRLVTQVDGCSVSSVSNVVEIAVGSAQCDDFNPCTNDICNNGSCLFECTIGISNVTSTNTSVQGCSDGSVSAIVSHPACTGEWNALLFNGNTIVKSWTSTQGATILWNNVPPGNYLIVATDFGDCSDSAQVGVGTQLPCSVQIANAQTTATSTLGCSDGSVSATVQAVVCNGEWFATLFNQANATVATWLSTQGNSIVWNNIPAGNYRIFVTDNKVCNAQQHVTVASGPSCSLGIQGLQTTVVDCDNNFISAQVTANTCGGIWVAYLYDTDFTDVFQTWSSASGSTIIWNEVELGNYQLIAINFSGCSDTLSVSLSCSDNDPCTNDFCTGGCNYAPRCNDGIACTQDVCLTDGTCSHTPIVCNDNNPCTIDFCSGGNCVFNPRNCNDNNACTSDNCVGGVCVYTNICGGVTISGYVLTALDTPVAGVTLYLSGSVTDSFVTGANGFYSFTVAAGGSYEITPVKNNDIVTNNGITTNDIALIRRHLLGSSYLDSPYKVIAADASNSGRVTTTDIPLVRIVVLNDKSKFPPLNSRLWDFVASDHVFSPPAPNQPYNPFPFPKTRTYASLSADQSGQNFIGVKIGDVNFSWKSTIP